MRPSYNVKITSDICDLLLSDMKKPEQGAVLGVSDNGIVDAYYFDRSGSDSSTRNCYTPDIDILNSVITSWANNGIRFCGIAHSHPLNQPDLSAGDIRYASELCRRNDLNEVLMPIVIPFSKIEWYIVDSDGMVTKTQAKIIREE